MEDDRLHLDHALAEEFAGHSETIHKLKVSDAYFAHLLERNRGLWEQIQHITSGLEPTDDAVLEQLRKQRLSVLDEIGDAVRKAER